MSERHHDPVHRTTYAFAREGDDLLVDTWIEPGGVLPPHHHPRQTEVWWVVDGEVRFTLDGDTRRITAADGELVVHPGSRHGLKASAATTSHLRCRVTPALGLEEFLVDSSAAARDGLFVRGGIPRNLRGARWAARFLARHQDDVVMAFPPAPVRRAMIALLARE